MILQKIIEIGAMRCQILKLKCTKFDCGWGSAQDPAGGAYSVVPDDLAGFQGSCLKGREDRGRWSKGSEGEGTRVEAKGRGGYGKGKVERELKRSLI